MPLSDLSLPQHVSNPEMFSSFFLVVLIMGNTQLTLPKDSPLGCLLKNLKALGLSNLKLKHLIFYCSMAWPQYKLGD